MIEIVAQEALQRWPTSEINCLKETLVQHLIFALIHEVWSIKLLDFLFLIEDIISNCPLRKI